MITAEPRRAEVMPGPQADFILSTARYPAYIGGRGSGKSVASIFKAFKYINENPGQGYAMMTVPTLGDIDKILLPRIRYFFGHLEGSDWEYHEKKTTLFFKKLGWTIWVRPASEPDSCRGPDLAFASMDEIGTEDQEETFRILQAAIRLPGFPNQLWVTSTPNVRRSWIKKRWVDHVNPLDDEPLPAPHQYPIFRAKTADNYNLPQDWKDELIAEWGTSRWARQELEGEFIAIEGQVFPELSAERHLVDPPPNTVWIKTVAGIDFGATSPTAVLLWKMDESRRVWLVDEFYKRNATDYDWVKWCADREVRMLMCDPSASDDKIRFWEDTFGVYCERSPAKGREDRFGLWRNKIATDSLFISRRCQATWDELTNLQWKKPKGHDYERDEFAPWCQDHAYDAGAYGMSGLEYRYGAPKPIPVVYGNY